MFLGVLNPTEAVSRRLDHWAETLWPGYGRLAAAGRVEIRTSPDAGILPVHQAETPELLAAIDGYVWRGDRIAATPEGASETVARLGRRLASSIGWPLPDPWDGSYCCAVFDRRDGSLHLAVDAVGIRRLYYARQGEQVVFGNVQGSCAYALGLEPDLCGAAQWLATAYTYGRRTLFSGLSEVLPGEKIHLSGTGAAIGARYDRPWHRNVERMPPEKAAERIAPLLLRHGDLYRNRGIKLGLALSAGLDSRLVLGAMGAGPERLVTYTYGGSEDYEMKLAARCARAAGYEHRVVDLVGRYFPAEAQLRTQAVTSEAVSYPFWMAVGEAAEADGIDTLLTGDMTNCLQVLLWRRGAHLRQRLKDLVPFARPDYRRRDETSSGPWLEAFRRRVASTSAALADTLGLDVGRRELEDSVAAGLEELYDLTTGGRETSMVELQERFYLATQGKHGASQALSLAWKGEISPLFATRQVLEAATNVDIEARSWGRLLDALAKEMLPRSLRRIPVATIPVLPLDAPKLLRELAWVSRWLVDRTFLSLHRKSRGRWSRERLFRALPLQPEYRRAARDFYGSDWAVSGVFPSAYFVGRVRRTAAGKKPPVVSENEMRAVCADSIYAAAKLGPDFVSQLADHERR